jgi:hypothetical protein
MEEKAYGKVASKRKIGIYSYDNGGALISTNSH